MLSVQALAAVMPPSALPSPVSARDLDQVYASEATDARPNRLMSDVCRPW